MSYTVRSSRPPSFVTLCFVLRFRPCPASHPYHYHRRPPHLISSHLPLPLALGREPPAGYVHTVRTADVRSSRLFFLILFYLFINKHSSSIHTLLSSNSTATIRIIPFFLHYSVHHKLKLKTAAMRTYHIYTTTPAVPYLVRFRRPNVWGSNFEPQSRSWPPSPQPHTTVLDASPDTHWNKSLQNNVQSGSRTIP